MIRKKRTKSILGAAIVITVVLALVMPISAVVANDEKTTDSYRRMEIQGCKPKRPLDNTFSGESVIVSNYEGDDISPSITKDLDGHTVVTWTNEQSFSETFFGISYSDDTSDPDTWYDNSLVLEITGNDMSFDTALIQGPEAEDYKGLMGVFFSLSEETVGYYEIEDITSDYADWPIYSWSSTAADPYYAAISDSGYVENFGPTGPYYFYVFNGDLCGDLPRCPIFVFLDVAGDGGSFYYDCQEYEQTAPCGAPDYVYADAGTYYHTVVYNVDTEKVIWKKVEPAVEADYEYTPFQATIADGTNPKIATYGTNVAVVFANGGEIKCVYSDDDGENWDTTTIATGSYPDICSIGTSLLATYINGGNLYLVASKDGGATWGAAVQVNDVEGTVVADENSVDIHSAGIVWVDDRGEDYDIYFAPLAGPSAPLIDGKAKGKAGDEYEYTFVSTDSVGSDLYYYIDWGDGKVEDWIGPYASGSDVKVKHTWSEEDTYSLKAKAKNTDGVESDWGTLEVSMPVNKVFFLRFLEFLGHFPNAFPLLRYLLGL